MTSTSGVTLMSAMGAVTATAAAWADETAGH